MYLDAETTIEKLIAMGLYTQQSVPSVEAIELVIEALSYKLDDWLGWRPYPTSYSETIQCGRTGILLLPQYPVISVEKVSVPVTSLVGQPELPPAEIAAAWDRGQRIYMGRFRSLSSMVQIDRMPVLVEWRAGLSPVPKIFEVVMMGILVKVLQKGGVTADLGFIDEPYQEVVRIKLPGGLEKQFSDPGKQTTSDRGAIASNADALFAGLNNFKRRLRV